MPTAAPERRPAGLARLGSFCARHPWWVLAAWIVLLVAALGGRKAVGPTFSDQVSLPGTQSDTGKALLAASDPAANRPDGQVVFHVAAGTVSAQQQAVDQSLGNLKALPHVTGVSSPLTSTDGRTVSATVSFDEQLKQLGHGYTARLDDATGPARAAGVGVGYGGDFTQIARPPANDLLSELVGIGAALVILLAAFGSVGAAVTPLVTALVAVAVGTGVVGIVAGVITFATTAPTLATMLGLGVGIDYALFLTTRFRQDLIDGRSPVDAAGRTAGTSGHAIAVAAITVVVALLSLYASGLSFIGKLGLAATIAVLISAAAALTLVPAALGLAGRSIDRLAVRRPVAETSSARDSWHRYAALIERHRWTSLAAGLVLPVVCAVPVFSMRLGHVDAGADPSGSTTRHAYDWIAAATGPGFGPGANGPFTVVTDVRHATVPASQISAGLSHALQSTHGVASATQPQPSPDGALLVSTVTPTTGPQTASTSDLFRTLTDHTLPGALHGTGAKAYLTGTTAGQLDFRDTVARRLPIIIGIVLVLAYLLLMAVFRSLVIPLKAVLLNLLTTAASWGALVAVFQWGWGDAVLGLPEGVPIESYVPMMMFAIVFGLSMDYEIFLLSRMAAVWDGTHDNTRAVAGGLAVTGRVVSSAALIMTVVFLSFTASPTVVVKMLALGLAFSVILDATVVRLVLVPSLMFLMGASNWWLPRRLARTLPHLHA
ncbi:MMPL family transporter [Actinomadura violacea]|uniref:MMPL family transporter n=1 Tax=Actinomadura violacea TaxID=2819934 RepID=A0ABS3RHT8_9ACTN|nr:MMPL family transporter [Actinomadura violacea]MBO2456296.1 MMPL family transporter [Actinomadura violacea]